MNKKKLLKDNDWFYLFFLKGNRPFYWLAILSFMVFCRTLSFGFSPLDDYMLIVKRLDWLLNCSLSEVFTKGVFKTDGGSDYYRPLLVLSFKLDAIIGKGQPWMFHLTNVLIHSLSTLLVFVFLRHFIETKKAFVFVLLFATYPVLTHTVAWIPGRNDSLLAVFSLASIIFLIRYIKDKKMIFLLLHLFLFICVLFTKESALLMPLLFMGVYWLFNKNKKVLNTIILTCLWILITLGWWFFKNNIVKTEANLSLFDLKRVFIDALLAFVMQTGKAILPFQQAVLPNTHDTSLIPGLLVIVILISLSIKYKFNDYKVAFLGLGWFVIFLVLPTLLSAFEKVGIQYEHRLYVSMVGMMLFISQIKLKKIKWSGLIIIMILVFFIIKTNIRSKLYRNSFSFAFAAAAESPSSAVAFNLLGNEYNNRKDYDKAIKSYSQAIELDSLKISALFNRGNAYKAKGNINLALVDYNKGLKKDSFNAKGFFDRGNIYFDLGQFDKAIFDYDKAILIYPGYSNAHNNRGNAYARLKKYNRAMADFTRAIYFRPNNANAYNNRGNLYSELREFEKALADYNSALAIKPGESDFLANRDFVLKRLNPKTIPAKANIKLNAEEEQQLIQAYTLYKQKNYQQALSIFEKLVLSAKQKNDKISEMSHRNNIGLCHIKMGNYAKAEQELKAVIREDPQNHKAHSNLKLLYKTLKKNLNR